MNLVSIDYKTLPAALLPDVKAHCIVEHGFDDAYLVKTTARAIQHFEVKTETRVFAATYTWTPGTTGWVDGRIRAPITPVTGFTAMVDATDVSADYSFETDSGIPGTGIYWLVGENQTGLSLTELKTGYTNADDIPPGILDRILHLVSTYYENRGLFIPSGQFLNPLGQNADLAGWWLPKC